MLGYWSRVRAKDWCLFKYTKNLFRFDRRSHILKGSGALLITFLWQKNGIMATATYHRLILHVVSLQKVIHPHFFFCVPAATWRRWGRRTKMPSWRNTTSSWASCLPLWRLLPTLWSTNLLLMGVQIQAQLSMRVDGLTLPASVVQSLCRAVLTFWRWFSVFACLLPNLKPNTDLFPAFRPPWPF